MVYFWKLKEEEQYLHHYSYLFIHWYDELLTWDPHMYGDIQQIEVDSQYIWIPVSAQNIACVINQTQSRWHLVKKKVFLSL